MPICKDGCSEDPNGDCYVCGNPTPSRNPKKDDGEE